MELREIEYFIAIVENHGLSGAARELFVSQSALSQFLLKLETQVGTPLFLRNYKSLTLTEAGEIYYENAKKILQIKQETLLQIEKCIERNNNHLNIGVTGIRTFRYASEIISQLSSLYPNCKARIVEGLALELFEQLKQGNLDFLIAPYVDDPDVCYTPFKVNEILAILPVSHPLAHLGKEDPDDELNRIDIHDLASSRFVLCKKGTALRRFCDLYFEKKNFKPNILAEGVYNLSATELVEEGKAVTLDSPYYGRQIKNVRFVALNDPMHYMSGIAYCKGTVLTPAMDAFLNLSIQNANLY